MLTETQFTNCGSVMLDAECGSWEGAWWCHPCCSSCVLSLYPLTAKLVVNTSFALPSPSFFIKAKNPLQFSLLLKTSTNAGPLQGSDVTGTFKKWTPA